MDNLKSYLISKFRLNEQTIWKPILLLSIIVLCVWISQPIVWPGGWGIGKDDLVTTIVETDKRGNIIKTTKTTTNNDGKTFWDWLSLLGAPLTLAIFGYWLQQLQQQRVLEETKEEVLQVYFDRISVLLIDKNLIAISAKIGLDTAKNEEKELLDTAKNEEKELLDSSKDIIRARTLSILRRFENDAERKTSVIRFLAESDIISKLKLNLSKADLTKTKLIKVNLSEANFSWANLAGSDLSRSNLSGSNFSEANLTGANLENIKWNQKTKWPDKSELIKAKNIPDKLRKELGLDEETKA